MATKKTSKKTSKKTPKKTAAKKTSKKTSKKSSAGVKKTSATKKSIASKKKASKKKSSSPVTESRTEEVRSVMEAASDADMPDFSSQDYATPTFSSGVSMEDEKRQGPPVMAIVLGVIVVAILLFVARDIWMGPGDEDQSGAQTEESRPVMQSQGDASSSAEEQDAATSDEESEAEQSPASDEDAASAESASGETRSYTVKDSDTGLYQIASDRLGKGSRWKEIQELNKNVLKGGTAIKPGMKLKLPAK